MKKVAVFGNAGGGKSTIASRLADITGLPLYILDIITFQDCRYWPDRQDGGRLSDDEYLAFHRNLLARDRWIIEGYGSAASLWARLTEADTLVFIDLPVHMHYWGVTQRLVQGALRNPAGWPENSPIWESTLDGYRVIGRCHRSLTPKYRAFVAEHARSKRVHHLRSRSDARAFLAAVERERG